MTECPAAPCKFYMIGQCRFGDDCRNSHAIDVPVKPVQKTNIKKTKNKATHKNKDEEQNQSSKLPSMKTARDVIQRIQWDTDVPSEHFTVGYLDRFVGVIEQAFDTFDWSSDLASVDYQNVLAIPQHRIQYFKYRDRKLWDKNERLDLIFGSTSSSAEKTEISDLLRNIDEELLFCEDFLATQDAAKPELDFCNSRPTHFLAIRIDDTKLLAILQETVAELAGGDLLTGIVAPELYHCTLAVLTLDSVDQVRNCISVLKSAGPELFRESPESLVLKGVSTFGQRVLFSGVQSDPKLDSTVLSLVGHLKSQEVQVVDRPHRYHVSLVKGLKHVTKLDQNGITQRSEMLFGRQPVSFVHLCAMREGLDTDGFYRVVTSIQISESDSLIEKS